jgi:TPR repeat protein
MPRNLSVALLLSAACTFAAAQSDLDRAQQALAAGKAEAAVKLLTPLAERGDAAALLQRGLLHYNGQGVPENEKRAIELLSRSAKAGNVEAMYQLGNVYTFGHSIAQLVDDPDTEAARWYHQAAVAGNADAQYSLALLFMAGKGVVKDPTEADFWMRKAAQAGHVDAKSYIGR